MNPIFRFPAIDKNTQWQILATTEGDQDKIATAITAIWSLDDAVKTNNHAVLENIIAAAMPHLEQLVQVDETIRTSLTPPPDTRPYLNRHILIASQKLLNAPAYPAQAVRAVNIIALVSDMDLALQAWSTLLDFTEHKEMPQDLRARIPVHARDAMPGDREISIRFSRQVCNEYMLDQVVRDGQLDIQRLRKILNDPNEQHDLWEQARRADEASERSNHINVNNMKYGALLQSAGELRQRIRDMNDPPPPNRPYRNPDSPDAPPTATPS